MVPGFKGLWAAAEGLIRYYWTRLMIILLPNLPPMDLVRLISVTRGASIGVILMIPGQIVYVATGPLP